MNQKQINNLIADLLSEFLVYAPVKVKDFSIVKKIPTTEAGGKVVEKIDWSGQIPKNTFKQVFLPVKEELFEFSKNNKTKEIFNNNQSVIAWGMSILDLQAFCLFEQVFEKDVYYQKRRRNTLVVGYSQGISSDLRKYKLFQQGFEENILEHLLFDVFIEKQDNGEFKFFSGSEKGQEFLENYVTDDYINIEFAGLIPEEGKNKRMLGLIDKVKDSFDNPVWQEIAEKCIACGKCSIHCPTCFCFDEFDQVAFDSVKKVREWTTCFYKDFSKMSDVEKLDTIKKRLYFWYYHKFVRIPKEFSILGCVSCKRCEKVCPVGIKISEVLGKLNN